MNWLNPEPEQQQTGTQITKPSSDDHIKVVYGEQKIAGTIVFYNTTNPDDGDDVKNDLLHIIVVWCEGGIESIDDILLNDISITDSKFSAKKGGRWAFATHFTNGMGGYSDPYLKASGWDAATKDHRLDGLACSYIRLEWSLGDDTPFTGLPDLNAVIRGRKVKNLETGVTEYSENPAYCTLDYLTNPIFGKNLSASDYDLDSFKTAGLIAKTQVPEYQGASTTKPLFTCNLAIDTSASLLDNVELLGKSMRALMPIINGRLTLIIEQDEEPTEYGLSERDFKGSLKYDDGGKDKRYNRVIVEYIDKELSYSDQDAIYPEPDSELADQWLAEDNGVLLEYRFKVSSCNNYYEARQMARIIAMISRESLNFNVLCAPIAMRYTVGDVVPISHNKLGWAQKPFRLIKSVQQSTGQFLLTFREHQPYIYNWLSGVVRPPIPDTSLPDPRNVAAPVNFTSVLLNDGNVQINWESVYSHFDIQIYKDGTLLSTTTSVTPSFIISALDAGNYEIDVRAASKIGFRSDWVSFGFSVALPGVPVVNIDAVTYNTITLSASVTGASLGTTFEWQFLGQTAEPNANPNTASGYNYIYTGLVPDTEYSFKVRTKNLSGVSPWVSVAVKTSLSDLLDYIDDIPLQKLSEDAQTLIEDINTQVDRLRDTSPNSLTATLSIAVDEIKQTRIDQETLQDTMLNFTSAYVSWRQNYEYRTANNERFIDAGYYVDPENGLIVNRAFEYTDKTFEQAQLVIDGVNSTIKLQTDKIEQTDLRLTNAEATLTVQAGKINEKASFTDVNTQIAGALEALTPAYSWQFNSSNEGFNALSHSIAGFITIDSAVTAPAISYDAQENPMFRLRVRKHEGAEWLGEIQFNDGAGALTLPEPTSHDWESIQLDTTGTDGYQGIITALKFVLGACDIDSIEIGKRGASDLALSELLTRTTTLENDIDAATGIMGQYATTQWINELGFQTQSDITQVLNTFDTTYQVTATLTQLNENGTLEKANNAQRFIDGAQGYITDRITSYINQENGVVATFTDIQQKLDLVTGSISNNILQVQGLELEIEQQNIDGVLEAYNNLVRDKGIAELGLKAAYANETITAQSNELGSVAQKTLDLAALYDENKSLVTVLIQAFSDEKEANVIRDENFEALTAETSAQFSNVEKTIANQTQAFAVIETNLKAKVDTDVNKALSTAKEYTRTAVGYCVDEKGDITDQSDAIACVADGGSWVNGPLAEYIANLQISDGESSASIKQLKQVFKNINGELVARGGWVLDNKGRAVSVAGYNDGETGNLDLAADVIRHGVIINDVFVPTFYLDNTDPSKPVQTLRGKMILGDNTLITSAQDIQNTVGSRLAVYYVATESGTWSDTVAASTVPNGQPLNGDIVNIYKYSDPKVSTTKKYNGSVWKAYVLTVNGNVFAKGSIDGDSFNSATTITAGVGANSVTLTGEATSDYILYTGTNPAAATVSISKAGKLKAKDVDLIGKLISGDGSILKGAHIENLSVDSLKIQNQAVTTPSSVVIPNTLLYGETAKTLMSLTFSYTTGGFQYAFAIVGSRQDGSGGDDENITVTVKALVNGVQKATALFQGSLPHLNSKVTVPCIGYFTDTALNATNGNTVTIQVIAQMSGYPGSKVSTFSGSGYTAAVKK